MTTIAWVSRRLLTQPLVWMWLALAAALGPAVRGLAPAAFGAEEGLEGRVLYELAFLSVLLGCTLVVALLDRFDELFRRAAPGRRLGTQAAAIMVGGAFFGLAGTALLWAQSPLLRQDAALVLGEVVVLAHLTALGVMLLQIPLPAGVRAWLVPGLGWLLPALVGNLPSPLACLPRALDASRPLVVATSHPSATALGHAFAPIMGMILVSLLVARPSPRGS